jgi:DNA adenine methylase
MVTNNNIAPFLKWVGGKRQIIETIQMYLPKKFTAYYEPFIGGGALLFHLQPSKAVINDFNEELINVYRVIKTNPGELVQDLKKHTNTAGYFYKIRSVDRDKAFEKFTAVQRASRIIYLNKTCFNGLYRVNSLGYFNTPFGKYKNPNIVNEQTIQAVSNYLNSNKIEIVCGDYAAMLQRAPANSFVYLDPPYQPVSASSSFTGYVKGGWNSNDQERLKNTCDRLDAKGVKFLLSNAGVDFIKDLYKEYHVSSIRANRSINAVGSKRGAVEELLIRNYE